MKDLGRLAILTVSALLSLSGCIVTPAHDHDRVEYRYENGDRIDSNGHREVHWCDAHHDDEHCR
ncbi:MAG TPA: hypothetical protein VGF89_01320 [Steroidobacteraceae bacterium]